MKWLIAYAWYRRGSHNEPADQYRNTVTELEPADWLIKQYERGGRDEFHLLWATQISDEQAAKLKEYIA